MYVSGVICMFSCTLWFLWFTLHFSSYLFIVYFYREGCRGRQGRLSLRPRRRRHLSLSPEPKPAAAAAETSEEARSLRGGRSNEESGEGEATRSLNTEKPEGREKPEGSNEESGRRSEESGLSSEESDLSSEESDLSSEVCMTQVIYF